LRLELGFDFTQETESEIIGRAVHAMGHSLFDLLEMSGVSVE
jgi:hypothetical protein